MTTQDTITTPPATAPGAPAPAKTPKAAKPKNVRTWMAGWDWHKHPPGWTTLNVALAVFTASWLGFKIGVEWWVPLTAGVIGAIGATAAGMVDEQTGARLTWRAACWLLPMGWSIAAVTWSPWEPVVLVIGMVLAVIFGVFARAITTARTTAAKKAAEKAAITAGLPGVNLEKAAAERIWNADDPNATNTDALAVNWRARIKRVTGLTVGIKEVELWSQGTGYTLKAKLQLGGQGWKTLASHAEELANDAGLPDDCGVVVRPPKGKGKRGWADVQVTHENHMDETITVPRDYSPLSIYHKLPFGILPDSSTTGMLIKWICMVLTGQTGSGKSAMLHLLNWMLGRCSDVLIWHIDVAGGGGVSRPWVTAWHERKPGADAPIVDWPAVTDAEAELMLMAALEIIHGRKRAYAKRMRDGKLPVDAEVPHIVIIMDEFGSLPVRVQELATKVSDEGRAAGVRTVACALRATSDYLPVPMLKQAHGRIGMRIDDEAELNYLFGWDEKIDPDLAPYEGSGFMYHQDETADGKLGKKFLTPFKAYYVDDDALAEAPLKMARLRPQLDEASRKLANSVGRANKAYDQRWERTLPKLFDDAESEDIVDEAPVDEDPEKAARRAKLEAKYEELIANPGSMADSQKSLQDAAEQLKADIDSGAIHGGQPQRLQLSDDDVVARITEIEAMFNETTADDGGSDDEDNGDEVAGDQAVMLQIITEAGSKGISPAEIREQLAAKEINKHTKTVHRWLKPLLAANKVVKTDRGAYVAKVNHREED